jgi:hypothetical protein
MTRNVHTNLLGHPGPHQIANSGAPEIMKIQPDVSLVTALIGFGWNQSPEPRGHTQSVPVLARFDNPAAVRSREYKIVGFLVVATSTQKLANFGLFVWWLYALYVEP